MLSASHVPCSASSAQRRASACANPGRRFRRHRRVLVRRGRGLLRAARVVGRRRPRRRLPRGGRHVPQRSPAEPTLTTQCAREQGARTDPPHARPWTLRVGWRARVRSHAQVPCRARTPSRARAPCRARTRHHVRERPAALKRHHARERHAVLGCNHTRKCRAVLGRHHVHKGRVVRECAVARR